MTPSYSLKLRSMVLLVCTYIVVAFPQDIFSILSVNFFLICARGALYLFFFCARIVRVFFICTETALFTFLVFVSRQSSSILAFKYPPVLLVFVSNQSFQSLFPCVAVGPSCS